MTTLAHLSDLHFGRLDPRVAESLLEELHERQPDLIVVSGDFTQRARRREFEAARAYVERFPSRPLMVPGNHDVANYHLVLERFMKPVARFRHYLEDDLFPRMEEENVRVLGINSARPAGWYLDWSRGRISTRQLHEIDARFRERKNGEVRILVTHHPFIFPPEQDTRHLVRGPKDMLRRLASCGVDLILAGHFHRAWSDVVATRHPDTKSIVVAQASTSTSTRLKEEPNAFNWIEIDSLDLLITSHEWRETAFTPTASKHYRRENGEWQRIGPQTSRM